MMIDEIVNKYFDVFCKKNLDALSDLYADNIILNEWNSNIFIGKEQVLEANKKLFEEFGNIEIDVRTSGVTGNKSINEIVVMLDDANVNVVDVLTIKNEKITYIMAYRGF